MEVADLKQIARLYFAHKNRPKIFFIFRTIWGIATGVCDYGELTLL